MREIMQGDQTYVNDLEDADAEKCGWFCLKSKVINGVAKRRWSLSKCRGVTGMKRGRPNLGNARGNQHLEHEWKGRGECRVKGHPVLI